MHTAQLFSMQFMEMACQFPHLAGQECLYFIIDITDNSYCCGEDYLL